MAPRKKPAKEAPPAPIAEDTKPKGGRPTTYTEDIAARICVALSEGSSLVAICKADDMPAQSTVYLWLLEHEKFSENYARARAWQGDTLADKSAHILQLLELGSITPDVARAMLDAIKWYAGKLAPKKYGDRVALDHGAQDSLQAVLEAVDGKTRGLPNTKAE